MSHVVNIEGEGDADDEEHHGQAVGSTEGLHGEEFEDADDAKESLAKLMTTGQMCIQTIKHVDTLASS